VEETELAVAFLKAPKAQETVTATPEADETAIAREEGPLGAEDHHHDDAGLEEQLEAILALEQESGLAPHDEATVAKLLAAEKKLWAYSSNFVNEMSDETQRDSHAGTARSADRVAAARERAAKRKKAAQAQRERTKKIIVWQLLNRELTKAQREKFVRYLLELGISEVEYRALAAKLNTLDEQRIKAAVQNSPQRMALRVDSDIPVDPSSSAETRDASLTPAPTGFAADARPVRDSALPNIHAEQTQSGRSRAELYRTMMERKRKAPEGA
jgi:hypothetical protein